MNFTKNVYLVCLWLSCAASSFALDHVQLKRDGRLHHLSGKLLVEAQDGGLLVQAEDGRLWTIRLITVSD